MFSSTGNANLPGVGPRLRLKWLIEILDKDFLNKTEEKK